MNQRIAAFSAVGEKVRSYLNGEENPALEQASLKSEISNGWFVQPFIKHALNGIANYLDKNELNKWISSYKLNEGDKRVGVIMPGNIPAAGFFDALCVLISGNRLLAKLSSDDSHLIPVLLQLLIEVEPGFKDRIVFGDFRENKPDAVIATGSNNTARYFEYYFSKYPNIIRRNRNSVAVVTGEESVAELDGLADDVFLYFGLGCRSVSKIFIPRGYDKDKLFSAFFRYSWVVQNKKYGNNYDYHKTLYLMNNDDLLENGFLLMKHDIGLNSPMATLYVEEYEGVDAVRERLRQDSPNIQCVVARPEVIKDAVPFGKAQSPSLFDYPDKVDVMKFLSNL